MQTMKRSISLAAVLVLGGVIAAGSALAAYPSAKQLDIAKNGKYLGADACKECHADTHKGWATSRHTDKAKYGPAIGKDNEKNI